MMNNFRFGHCPVLVLALAFSSLASAQATRTWISGVGDDANPCSRTAPCKTWAGAISKTATGGEIDALDPGGFGALTITKSITLDGGGGQIASALVSGTNGITIDAPPPATVILRNLQIAGLGLPGGGTPGVKGISVIAASTVIIDRCDIFGFGLRGISIENTSGVLNVFIRNSRIEAGQNNGVVVVPSGSGTAQVQIEDSQIIGNTNYGVVTTPGTSTSIRNTRISGHGQAGIRLNSGAEVVDLDTVTADGNGIGIDVEAGTLVRIANSSVVQNTIGLAINGGMIQSFQNNRIVGNGSGNSGVTGISLQ